MSKWFYRKDGKDHGPKSDRRNPEVADSLHHFVGLPKADSSSQSPGREKSWVLLQRKEENNETRFVQSGPYSIDEILDKIHGGEAGFDDYAWRRGQLQWQRIGSMPEFDRRKQEDDIPESPGNESTKTFPDLVTQSFRLGLTAGRRLLQSVVAEPESAKEKDEVDAERPPEAEGPDLTAVPVAPEFMPPSPPGEDLSITSGIQLSDDSEMIDLSAANAKEPSSEQKTQRKAKKKRVKGIRAKRRQEKLREIRRTQIAVAVTMATAVGVLAWTVYRHSNRTALPVSLTVPPVTKTKKQPVRPQSKPKWVARPTLVLVPQNLATERAKLVIRTNAAEGQRVRVTVTGVTGQFIGPLSFRKSLILTKTAGEDLTLSFKRLEAPTGLLKVNVKSASSRKEISLFLGNKDSRFLQALGYKLKKYSTEYQREKKQLYYLARIHGQRADQLLRQLHRNLGSSQWKKFYRSWQEQTKRSTTRELESFSAGRWENYAWPRQWKKLQKYRRQLTDLSRQLDDVGAADGEGALQPQLRELSSRLRDFREEIAELSMYKPF